MTNDPVDGGTVRYHRADWIGEKIKPVYPWMVQFVEDGPIHELTKAEGEAMGLTPPEPAPLVVTCNGHSIELSDEEARAFVQEWDLHGDREDFFMLSNHDLACDALAGLLRDARQDPQPTADSEPWPWGDEGFMCPKMVRETLCVAQGVVGRSPEVDFRRDEHVRRIQRMIDWCDRHRPIGPDGKHGTRRCTPTCGCEDKGEPITPVQRTVDSFTILDPQPTADTPSDDIDFDALPIGTVLKTYNGYYVTKGGNGNWFDSEQAHGRPDQLLAPYTVVYQPAPLSPRQHLEALLAGRDDADELIDYAKQFNYPHSDSVDDRLMHVIGDAARGDDIERADGDLVPISVSVYPCDGDENPHGEWVVQAVVDLGVVSDGG